MCVLPSAFEQECVVILLVTYLASTNNIIWNRNISNTHGRNKDIFLVFVNMTYQSILLLCNFTCFVVFLMINQALKALLISDKSAVIYIEIKVPTNCNSYSCLSFLHNTRLVMDMLLYYSNLKLTIMNFLHNAIFWWPTLWHRCHQSYGTSTKENHIINNGNMIDTYTKMCCLTKSNCTHVVH